MVSAPRICVCSCNDSQAPALLGLWYKRDSSELDSVRFRKPTHCCNSTHQNPIYRDPIHLNPWHQKLSDEYSIHQTPEHINPTRINSEHQNPKHEFMYMNFSKPKCIQTWSQTTKALYIKIPHVKTTYTTIPNIKSLHNKTPNITTPNISDKAPTNLNKIGQA